MRKDEVKKLLKEASIEEGDFIEIRTGGKTYRGMLLPSHAFSQSDIIIKLENGYNVGIVIDGPVSIKLIGKKSRAERGSRSTPHNGKKPTVSLIGTGGTIASRIDYATGAVHPASTSEEIALSVPEIFDICNLNAKVIFQKFGEDIAPSDWAKIAEETAKELNSGADGVIISHGTDTMSYTSAALSFMLKNLNGPVVLTGSQRSSDRPSSDAFQNLLASARVATSDLGEVAVVMHGTPSSGQCHIYRATKVRKMHSSRRDAFRSINGHPLGFVDSRVHLFKGYRRKGNGEAIADTLLNTNVSLLYYHPNLDSDTFLRMVEGKEGVVIAGTGLGHVSNEIVKAIKEVAGEGTTVVMTTQCIWGRVNMNVYATGRRLIEAGVISGEDMLPETALVKLMWVLAHFEGDEIKKMMGKNIAGEISERMLYDAYPEQKKYMA